MVDDPALDRARELLVSPELSKLTIALAELRNQFTRRRVGLLFDALSHPKWIVRREASGTLGHYGDAVIPILWERFETANDDQIYWTCRTLGKLGSHASIVLGKIYSQGNLEVRRYVVQALAKRPFPDAVPSLVVALDDPEWSVRKAAAQALMERGEKETVANAIMEDMDPSNPNRVFWGIIVLFRSLGKKSLGVIEKLAATPDPDMRYLALQALACLEVEPALPRLMANLSDPSPIIRDRAATLLTRFGKKAIPGLEERIDQFGGDSLTTVIYALSRIDSARALERAGALVTNSMEDRRHGAIRSLGLIGGVDAAQHLTRAFGDPSWLLRYQAFTEICRLGENAVGPVCRCLYSNDTDSRYWAIRSLARLGEVGLSPLREFYRNTDKENRLFVLQAISEEDPQDSAFDMLLEALDDENWILRQTSATILGDNLFLSLSRLIPLAILDRGNRGYWAMRVLKDKRGASLVPFVNHIKSKEESERHDLARRLERLTINELDTLLEVDLVDLDQALSQLDPAPAPIAQTMAAPGPTETGAEPRPDSGQPQGEGLERFLKILEDKPGSRLELVAGAQPAIRDVMEARVEEGPRVTHSDLTQIMTRLGIPLESEAPETRAIRTRLGDCRIRSVGTPENPHLSIEALAPIATADESMSRVIDSSLKTNGGLILVGSPPRCGRHTWIEALIDRVNSGHRLQVVCIEQILRRKHSGKSAHITQIKWNGDPASLPALIRSSARAGAQVLTVSDVPDSATLRALIEASRAGCLVIAATLARSLQQMIEDFCQMTGDENGFIDGSCPWRGRFIEELRWVVHQLLFRDRRQGLLLPVREILLVTPTAKEAIRTGNLEPLHDIIKGGRPVGMAGRDDALKKLVYEGRLSLDEATRWCHSLPEFAVNKVFSEGQGRGKL